MTSGRFAYTSRFLRQRQSFGLQATRAVHHNAAGRTHPGGRGTPCPGTAGVWRLSGPQRSQTLFLMSPATQLPNCPTVRKRDSPPFLFAVGQLGSCVARLIMNGVWLVCGPERRQTPAVPGEGVQHAAQMSAPEEPFSPRGIRKSPRSPRTTSLRQPRLRRCIPPFTTSASAHEKFASWRTNLAYKQ